MKERHLALSKAVVVVAAGLAIAYGALLVASTAAVSEPHTVRPPEADFAQKLIQAAVAQTTKPVTYDGSYRRIPYPGGDVPASIGVCTDLIVRAYRAVGVDLQLRVHEDMRAAFGSYPQLWGLSRADSNIDHRRVPTCRLTFGAMERNFRSAVTQAITSRETW